MISLLCWFFIILDTSRNYSEWVLQLCDINSDFRHNGWQLPKIGVSQDFLKNTGCFKKNFSFSINCFAKCSRICLYKFISLDEGKVTLFFFISKTVKLDIQKKVPYTFESWQPEYSSWYYWSTESLLIKKPRCLVMTKKMKM